MKDDVLAHAPPSGALFEQDSEVARLIETLSKLYYRFDADVGQLREDRYIETATGRELDRRAEPLGVERPTNERDEKFRLRALAARARSTSGSTFQDFANTVLMTLDAEPQDVTLKQDYTTERGAIIVEIDSSVLDSSPFQQNEIVELLQASVQASRRVVLRKTDSFQFSKPGTTSEKQGKGFADGQWTQ